MARVDFFLERAAAQLYVNEINTIPGFTATSVYAAHQAGIRPVPPRVEARDPNGRGRERGGGGDADVGPGDG